MAHRSPDSNRPDKGQFINSAIRLGSRGDSYYEYLLKQYLQTVSPISFDAGAGILTSPRIERSKSIGRFVIWVSCGTISLNCACSDVRRRHDRNSSTSLEAFYDRESLIHIRTYPRTRWNWQIVSISSSGLQRFSHLFT